ncbi:MAG: glycosyltransferase family 2 protein [bacterium]|nr:glycosyltransferase family 2 protein [bacterium]MDT8365612.1 glycosyltransferase family 2 protein [bacterium]
MDFLPVSRKITREIREFIKSPRFDPEASPKSDAAWPRISVITPSYNQAAFLERTILSIHNQDYPNLEHIVIDGGSTDGSVDIIRKYERRLAYWHTLPDRGQSDAINQGAGKATGACMTWINSDDLLLPGALYKMARAFMDDPETDLVYGDQVEVDVDDRVTKRVHTIDFDIRDFIYEINIIIHQQSALWRTDLFHRIGGLKLYRYAMDYDLFYRMHAAGANSRRIPDFLSAFRVHSEGLTGSGEVGRHRGEEVNAVFRDFTGRDRNLLDRAFLRYYYKARRFAIQPRALLGAMENRLWRLLHKGIE